MTKLNYSFILSSGIFISFIIVVASQAQQKYFCNPNKEGATDTCLGCICEASTSCNRTIGCISGGHLCGPFLISRAFWIDAGSCVSNGDVPTDPQAFVRCANDIGCASNTIRSYINRFEKDCNGDQLETCEDYVMLHKNGGWNCGKPITETPYWKSYVECREHVIGNGNNI